MEKNKILKFEEDVQIIESVMLIKIPRTYKEKEVYEATRCCWRVDLSRAQKVDYAFSVYQGRVVEIYRINTWKFKEERCGFSGIVASPEIRNKYIDKSVARYWKRGAQNPIRYINC